MNHDLYVNLIGKTVTKDEYKQEIAKETSNIVIGTQQSISSNEFFRASQLGFQPEFRLLIRTADYNDEKVVEVEGKRYGIYRKFNNNEEFTELYCREMIGV